MTGNTLTVGVISDTHDLLRPEARDALAGVDKILHAGDVCSPGILRDLETIAPVAAVRGNCDHGAWCTEIPLHDTWEMSGHLIHAVHDLETLEISPARSNVSVVVYGHSHEPCREEREGVIYLNPGSAGPRRFRLPVSLAIMTLGPDGPRIAFRELV